MTKNINQTLDFLFELDKLKLINRRTYINGGERKENSAEHSWHLAIACWTLANISKKDLNLEKLLKLALIHDLGEIEAGDTFLYSKERNNAHKKEREYLKKLNDHKGNQIKELTTLWDEQEYGTSKEAKFLKVVDRLLPFFHNIKSEGKAWREHKIKKSQVLAMHGFIENEDKEIYEWIEESIENSVKKSWLIDG